MNCSTPEPSFMASMSSKLRVLNLMDPRSPTTMFPRTPLQVIMKNSPRIQEDSSHVGTPVSETTSSLASFVTVTSPSNAEDSLNLSAHSNCSYLSLDCKSDIENFELSLTNLAIPEDKIVPESTVNDTDLERSMNEADSIEEILLEIQEPTTKTEYVEYTPSPPEVVQKSIVNLQTNMTPLSTKICDITMNDSIENNSVSKKLLNQHSATPTKKRNPLGAVDNICPTTPPSHKYGSPQNIFREKQWKRIQEERKKLGFEVDENVQLPMYDITASAPSKLMLRKSRIHERFNMQ